MATLETRIEEEDITHHILSGDLTVAELVDMMIDYNQAPTEKTIWNLTDTNPIDFNADNITKGIRQVAPHSMKHAGRRIAGVGGTDVSFGTARMILGWAQQPDTVNESKVFRRLDEAIRWLNS